MGGVKKSLHLVATEGRKVISCGSTKAVARWGRSSATNVENLSHLDLSARELSSRFVLFYCYDLRVSSLICRNFKFCDIYIYMCVCVCVCARAKNLKIKIYRTITLPVVLCGCETWSLTLREERRLRVFENRVLKVFGPKRDEVTGEWRNLHNEELNDLYSLPSIVREVKSRRKRWAGHVARMGEDRGVQRVLVGKAEGRGHWGDKT